VDGAGSCSASDPPSQGAAGADRGADDVTWLLTGCLNLMLNGFHI